jgi:hypothetical protein
MNIHINRFVFAMLCLAAMSSRIKAFNHLRCTSLLKLSRGEYRPRIAHRVLSRDHSGRARYRASAVAKSASTPYGYRLYAKTNADLWGEDSSEGATPLIPRHGEHNNYAAKWQSRGDHYVSYDNLKRLDLLLTNYNKNRSRSEKTDLLSELSMTYFARFHNIIREEYQYEKRLVEDRLRKWPVRRLQREGFALLDLAISPKGNLFQEKVFRFSLGSDKKLPFHRFGVGDTVRI